jgi:hypothetical protein
MGPRGRSENGVSDPTWEGEQKEKGTIGRVTLTSERDGRSEYSQLIASVFYWKKSQVRRIAKEKLEK